MSCAIMKGRHAVSTAFLNPGHGFIKGLWIHPDMLSESTERKECRKAIVRGNAFACS